MHGGGITYSTRQAENSQVARSRRGGRRALRPGPREVALLSGRATSGLGALHAAPRRCLLARLARARLPPALPPARLAPPPANAGRSEEPALTICCEAPPPSAAASLAGGSRPGTPPRRQRARGELYASLRCSLPPRAFGGRGCCPSPFPHAPRAPIPPSPQRPSRRPLASGRSLLSAFAVR